MFQEFLFGLVECLEFRVGGDIDRLNLLLKCMHLALDGRVGIDSRLLQLPNLVALVEKLATELLDRGNLGNGLGLRRIGDSLGGRCGQRKEGTPQKQCQ